MIVDTSVWVHFLNARETSETRVLQHAIEEDVPVYITGLVLAEILQGIRQPRRLATIRGDLLNFPLIEPKAPETYIAAATLYRSARRRGLTVRSVVDCVIAATAIDAGEPVLHRDRDYSALCKISSLREVTA
jgi:predicted nucleic acid-binding protein